jgi:hypothetical protein
MYVSDLPWTTVLIAVVGAVAIVAVALLIGVLESRSRQQAWLHIADARRANNVRSRALEDLLDELDELPLCPECRQRLRELSDDDQGLTL